MKDKNPTAIVPFVGLIGSRSCGTDMNTIEIVHVSKSKKTIKFMTVGHQRNPRRRVLRDEETARLTSEGDWKITYSTNHVYLDGPCDYHDPSF